MLLNYPFTVMLKIPKFTKNLQYFFKTPSFSISPSGFNRFYNDTVFNNTNGLDSGTEWERLLKPFDLPELRTSLTRITPYQLCKLLELPLDVPTSMELFQWAGTQKGYCHMFDVYYMLIDKLGAAGEFKTTDALLMQMKQEGIVFRESLFILIMKHYGRAGLPGQATRLLLDMRGVYSCEPTFRSYNLVLDVCWLGIALRLFPMFSMRYVRKRTCSKCSGLQLAGNIEKGLALFEDMMSKGLNPNNISCNILINGLCRTGNIQHALEFLRDMIHRGLTPDIVTYNSLINGLCKTGRAQEALNLFDKLQVEGICPDAITYNTLISWHCKEGMFDDAHLLLSRGVDSGFIPNEVTWYILVSNFIKEGDQEF
ncbi:unnamed protein product, partial [Vitis vinifera]